MSSELIVSTITLARSLEEETKIFNSLNKLSSYGMGIVVVDGGSPQPFLRKLSQIQNINLLQGRESGLFPQVRQSLHEAGKNKNRIFYTESDKLIFFSKLALFLDPAVKKLDDNPNFGIIVPSRSLESLLSFPEVQRDNEIELNKITQKIFNDENLNIDYAYGPMLIKSSLVELLENCPDDIGWGWMSYLRILAYKTGFKTMAVRDLDLSCPLSDQKETYEVKKYRQMQYEQHLRAIKIASN